jgi:hypothetical protein
VHIVRQLWGHLAVDQQIVIASDELQTVARNTGERFEWEPVARRQFDNGNSARIRTHPRLHRPQCGKSIRRKCEHSIVLKTSPTDPT